MSSGIVPLRHSLSSLKGTIRTAVFQNVPYFEQIQNCIACVLLRGVVFFTYLFKHVIHRLNKKHEKFGLLRLIMSKCHVSFIIIIIILCEASLRGVLESIYLLSGAEK